MTRHDGLRDMNRYRRVEPQTGFLRYALSNIARRLPVVHIGRSARIPRAAIGAFVAQLVAEATS
jgi:hypothetical protein